MNVLWQNLGTIQIGYVLNISDWKFEWIENLVRQKLGTCPQDRYMVLFECIMRFTQIRYIQITRILDFYGTTNWVQNKYGTFIWTPN